MLWQPFAYLLPVVPATVLAISDLRHRTIGVNWLVAFAASVLSAAMLLSPVRTVLYNVSTNALLSTFPSVPKRTGTERPQVDRPKSSAKLACTGRIRKEGTDHYLISIDGRVHLLRQGESAEDFRLHAVGIDSLWLAADGRFLPSMVRFLSSYFSSYYLP